MTGNLRGKERAIPQAQHVIDALQSCLLADEMDADLRAMLARYVRELTALRDKYAGIKL